MTVPSPYMPDIESKSAALSEADMELDALQAEEVLHKLAGVFSHRLESGTRLFALTPQDLARAAATEEQSPNLEAR